MQAAFKANKSLDGFLGLDPDVTIPCLDVLPKGTKAGTFDVGGAIKEIQAGRLMFAIDQQQYLQGYLPVVFAMLYVTNLNTVGNGAAGADRARDHQQGERGPGGEARHRGHALGPATRGGRLRPPARAGRQPMTETSSTEPPPPDERLTRVSPLSKLLARPDIGAMIGALVVWLAFGYFASERQLARRPRASTRAGPTRPRSTGSSRCRSRC